MLKSYWIHILYLWIVTAGSSFCSWVMYSTLEPMCRAQVAWSGCDLFSCLSRSFYLNALEHGLKLSHDLFRIAGIRRTWGLGRLLFELFTLTFNTLEDEHSYRLHYQDVSPSRSWSPNSLKALCCMMWFFHTLECWEHARVSFVQDTKNPTSCCNWDLFRICQYPFRAWSLS